MAELRLNFTINTDEHPELAHLEAGAARRGGRSTEVLRLLKLGAKADVALRELEGNRLVQVVQAGLLSRASPMNSQETVAVLAREATPVAPTASSAVSPVAGAYPPSRASEPVREASPPPAPPQPSPRPVVPASPVTVVAPAGSDRAGVSRRSGKSRASAFMG